MKALTELKKVCFKELNYFQECQVCFDSNPKILLIHHIDYTKDSVRYSQFENSDIGRIQYYAKLLDEIKSNPGNLSVLCFDCHKKLEELFRMEWIDAYNWLNDDDEKWKGDKMRLESLWEKGCKR